MSQDHRPVLDNLTQRAAEAERCAYRWCTAEARGSLSARTLATVYASIHLDQARLLRFADLRVLDDKRLEWALTLIRGYVEGAIRVPWARAVALAALYDLYSDND
ncbi:MAG: hypothetical protein KDK04_22230 [Candidatus Competibacteraceae bacterium]|nr:hypothetical protein [Candidatus Competibacteraceae bacterium]MCB1814414.1 hypothetical protein [Candidatus Competibacteraceae bacterium]